MIFFVVVGILGRFLLMERLSCSFLWSTQCVWDQHIWHGLGHTLWFEELKGWLSYVLIWSICFWERHSWEKTVMSALGSVALVQVAVACWGFSDTATHSSCPAYPGCFLSWSRSIFLQDSPQERWVPPMWELSVLFFLLTGHRMVYGAGDSNTKLFPLQT